MPESRPVTVVAYDDLQLLDLAGPVDVFEMANLVVGHRAYGIRVTTPEGAPVRSSSRVTIEADADLARLAALDPSADPIDTLIVVGGTGSRTVMTGAVLTQVAALASRSRRVTSVCTGALVLAAAGLLDGYRATTHWGWCDSLAEHSDIQVLPDQIYVRDRNRWTSAGVTAGIDLALALVEDDHGPELAHQVAAWLVVFARRPGGQAQFSATLQAQVGRTPAIAELQRWLPDHLTETLTVDRLAEKAAMSPRTFARVFRAETGITPAAHVEALRIEAARGLLETTDLTVDAIARRVGLRHGETLHRAFARRVGTTPARYRQHFTRATA